MFCVNALADVLTSTALTGIITLEKRTSPRNQLTVHFDIIDKNSKKVLGYMGNISEEGMLIVSDQMLPRQQTKRVMIKPDVYTPLNENNVEVDIEVKWTEQQHHLKSYHIGCHFVQPHPKVPPVTKQLDHMLGFDPRIYHINLH